MGVINKKGYEVIASKYFLYGNIDDDILVGFKLYESYVNYGHPDKKWHKYDEKAYFLIKTIINSQLILRIIELDIYKVINLQIMILSTVMYMKKIYILVICLVIFLF